MTGGGGTSSELESPLIHVVTFLNPSAFKSHCMIFLLLQL